MYLIKTLPNLFDRLGHFVLVEVLIQINHPAVNLISKDEMLSTNSQFHLVIN